MVDSDLEERKAKTELLVQRITVDEILADDLIRFEVCNLKNDVEEFLYDIDDWKDDQGLVVRGETYDIELGIRYPWDLLEEGQVFLFGNFEVISNSDGEPINFKVNLKKRKFLRIDHLDGFRDYIRRLYSDILGGD